MIVSALNRASAEEWILARTERREPTSKPYEIGSLPRKPIEKQLTTIGSELDLLTRELADLGPKQRPGLFDARASVVIHSNLPKLPINVASDRDFWRFVACGPLYEIVRWRHGGDEDAENFGLTGAFKGLPERLWFRAELSVQPEEDSEKRYALTRRGTVDFWASGPTRRHLGGSRPLVRALVRFQYPGDGKILPNGTYRPQTLAPDGIRDLYKRLSHFDGMLKFSMLDDDEAFALIEELASDLPRQE